MFYSEENRALKRQPAHHPLPNTRRILPPRNRNAATTQKPRAVLDALRHYYEHDNANVHGGLHQLSSRATGPARAPGCVASYLGAKRCYNW